MPEIDLDSSNALSGSSKLFHVYPNFISGTDGLGGRSSTLTVRAGEPDEC